MPISLKEFLWPLSFTTLIITSSGNGKTLDWIAWMKHHVDSYYLCITIHNYFLVSVENFKIYRCTYQYLPWLQTQEPCQNVFLKNTWQIGSLWHLLQLHLCCCSFFQLFVDELPSKKTRCFKPTVSTNQTKPRIKSHPPSGSNVSTYLGCVIFCTCKKMPPSAWSDYTYRTLS